MEHDCECTLTFHAPRLVVLTGGPGAGKTAVLEVIRKSFCRHVVVLPEAASVLFSGGFPRSEDFAMRMAAQRAIFHVQRELEDGTREQRQAAVILCDRGLLDGVAYWPGSTDGFFAALGTDEPTLLARYAAVLHLRTPHAEHGYDRRNPLRVESAEEASEIDTTIFDAWSRHPRRYEIESRRTFLQKVEATLDALRLEVPPCCRTHPLVLDGIVDRSHHA